MSSYLSGDLIKHAVKFTENLNEVKKDYSDLTKDISKLLESGEMNPLNIVAGINRICEAIKDCQHQLRELSQHVDSLYPAARKWEVEETVEAQREYVSSLTEITRSFVKLDTSNK